MDAFLQDDDAGIDGSRPLPPLFPGFGQVAAQGPAAAVGPTPTQAAEVAFISGVSAFGNVVAQSYWTWNNNNPATYNGSSYASKFGGGVAGSGSGTVEYYFHPGSSWTAGEKAQLVASLTLWQSVANLSFVETATANQAEITFTRGVSQGAFTSGSVSSLATIGSGTLPSRISSGITISTNQAGFGPLDGNFTTYGGYVWGTVIHEIGHALGLGHAGPYNFSVDPATQQFSAQDSHIWSIMSYIGPENQNPTALYKDQYPVVGANWGISPVQADGHQYYNSPTTFMPLDILAIQQLYGAPVSTPFSGGQRYGFNTNIAAPLGQFYDFTINTNPVVTIWNAGTGNTLDLSGYSTGSTVSLAPGTFSSAGGLVDNIAIAFNTIIETAIGGSGPDRLSGWSTSNSLAGGGGDDTLSPGAGAGTDTLSGDAGNDFVTYQNNTSVNVGIVVDLANGTAQLTTGPAKDKLVSIENAIGSEYGDTLYGDSNSNQLSGAGGDDLLRGGVGDDTLNGGAGVDVASYADATSAVSVSLGSMAPQTVGGGMGADALIAIEGLTGSAFNDTLTGDGGGNLLNGGAGGSDSLTGLGGDDILFVQNATPNVVGGADTLDGGAGNDTVSYALYQLTTGVSVDLGRSQPQVVTGETLIAIENAIGSAGTDTLSGDSNSNSLQGGGGDDLVAGGAGDDTLDGGAGNDTASYAAASGGIMVNLAAAGAQNVGGAQGLDTLIAFENLRGSAFADTLGGDTSANGIFGDLGDDSLTGGELYDTLDGGGGGDTLAGGLGNDSLIGGAGLDVVNAGGARSGFLVYATGALGTIAADQVGSQGADTITGVETLSFNATSFAYAGIQQNHLAVMDAGRFDDVILQSAASGKMVYADLDGTAGGAGLKTILGALPAGWKVVGSGDFTGDGRAEALIQNTNNGSIYTYGTSGWGVVSQSLTSDWQTRGVGDFTGDGTLDVLIRNSVTGQVVFAEMNGPTFGSWALGANVGTGWATIGVGDFDKDGYSDQLVQDLTTGTVLYANFDAGVQNGWGLVTGGLPPEWVAKEAVDLNGDGYFDVVFQNTSTGQVFYVNMAGGTNSGWGVVATVPGWNVVGSGDYDNDGWGDVLIRNASNGQLIYANMDNGVFQGWGVVTGALASDWLPA